MPALQPAKTEETISHHQNNDVKEVGTPPVQISLCTPLGDVLIAVWNKVTKTVSEKSTFENNSVARQTVQL